MSKKRLVIDLDGTICKQGPSSEYVNAEPVIEMIHKLQDLAATGEWHITIFTARGMDTYNGRKSDAKRNLGNLTRKWLDKYKVPYHRLRFGKPPADYYVDDKGMRPDEFIKQINSSDVVVPLVGRSDLDE